MFRNYILRRKLLDKKLYFRPKLPLKKFLERLSYPKLICFLQFLDLSTNIYKIVKINSSTFWMELLHIFLNCSEGIFIFIIFVRSTLFQTLFSIFYKNFKKRRASRKKNRNTIRSINAFINDKNTAPLIDNDINDENKES